MFEKKLEEFKFLFNQLDFKDQQIIIGEAIGGMSFILRRKQLEKAHTKSSVPNNCGLKIVSD